MLQQQADAAVARERQLQAEAQRELELANQRALQNIGNKEMEAEKARAEAALAAKVASTKKVRCDRVTPAPKGLQYESLSAVRAVSTHTRNNTMDAHLFTQSMCCRPRRRLRARPSLPRSSGR